MSFFFFIIYVGATETGRRRRLAGARVHNTHTHRDASTRESGEINQESTSAKGGVEKITYVCASVEVRQDFPQYSTHLCFVFLDICTYCFVFFLHCFLTQFIIYICIFCGNFRFLFFAHTFHHSFFAFPSVGYITHWICGFTGNR